MIKNVLSELDIKPNQDSLEYANKLILANFGYHRFSKCYKKSKYLKDSGVKNNIVNKESDFTQSEFSSKPNELKESAHSNNSKTYFTLKQSFFSKSLEEDKKCEKLKLSLQGSSKSFDKDSDYLSDAGSCISDDKTLDRNMMNNLMTELKRMRPYLSNLFFLLN